MRISKFLEIAPRLMFPVRGEYTTIHVKSDPGYGKSSLIAQMAKTYTDGVISTAMLANYGPMDVPGYGIPKVDDELRDVMTHTLPAFFVLPDGSTVFDHPRGILFLDEFGQADIEVKKAAAELVLNKRAGKWVLPDGWRIIMASNYEHNRSGVTRSLDHVINRSKELHLQPDPEALAVYLKERGYDDVFQAYPLRRSERVYGGAPKEQGPFMSPRSYEAAINTLMALARPDGTIETEDQYVQEAVTGDIGEANAADLLAFIALRDQLPEMSDIMDKPGSAKVPSGLDGLMIVAQMLTNVITKDNADSCIAYVKRFPDDVAVTFCKGAVKRMPGLLSTKAFTKWTAENHNLVAAIAALPSN